LNRFEREGLLEWSKRNNPRRKIYADDAKRKGKKRQDIWEFKDPQSSHYPTEKNFEMLKVIVSASSNPDDIVLDGFCGSGVTLAAAEALGRRWIGVDKSQVAIDTATQRLKGSIFALYRASQDSHGGARL
jgi:adenine-specific DNA-methyltransferase